ncbi:MAG: hypothetical protein AB7O59_06360 [Pirellulales bacterium]
MLAALTSHLPLWALAVIIITAVVSLYGLAALWATSGRGGWLARVAPAVLLLTALVPLGAYELIALFGAQVLTVVCLLVGGGMLRAFRAARLEGASSAAARSAAYRQLAGDGPRFGLRDLLQAVLLVAFVLAIVRFAARWIPMTPVPDEFAGLALVGVGLGVVTVFADWLVFGRSWWWLRVPIAATVATGFALLLWRVLGTNLVVTAVGVGSLIAFLGLARLSDWAFWRRGDGLASGAGAAGATANPRRPWLRNSARVAVGLAASAGLFVLLSVYLALLPPAPPQVALPQPNGHEELVKIAGTINWSAIPGQDSEAATVEACHQFAMDNASALARVRTALAMPSRVPVSYDPEYLTNFLPGIQELRALTRALMVEARLAETEGRRADAVQVYLDCVQLGDAAARGGLLVHELVGIALRSVGMQGLAKQVPHLNAAELSGVLTRLQQLDTNREPFEDLMAREELSASTSYPWALRLQFKLDDSMLQPAIEASLNARKRNDAQLQLILTEAAVRHYMFEHKVPPESLSDLVPKYFAAVPLDPYSDGRLVYRRTADGYVLYSVGINGRDDGGQRETLANATQSGQGDLFFDADPN